MTTRTPAIRAILLCLALLATGGLSMAQEDLALGAYEVKDPEILAIAERILATTDEQAGDVPLPNPHPDAQWFPKAGLGLFMHWGIHSVVGAQPSWAMIKDYRWAGEVKLYPPEKYWALVDRFDPQDYRPEKWLGAAARAKFQYAVLTTKHHDGYALWPSQFGDFNTGKYLDGRDLLEPYVEACRARGLKVGFYFSPRDWRYPNFPIGDVDFDNNKRGQYPKVDPELNRRRFRQFFAYTIGQLHELLTRYGKIDVLWFDGMHWHGIPDMHTKAVFAWIRSLQPGIVINTRWAAIQNPDQPGHAQAFGDFSTVECSRAESRPKGWWETCNIWDQGGGWGYDTSERVRSLEWTLENLIACRRWHGNYLPNLGPRPDGEMPRQFYERCAEIEEWMQRHAESVIGTDDPPDDDAANVPITRSGSIWYLHVAPDHPRDKALQVRGPGAIAEAKLLRNNAKMAFRKTNDGYEIDSPAGSDREVVSVRWE